jgi:hypothetical protein
MSELSVYVLGRMREGLFPGDKALRAAAADVAIEPRTTQLLHAWRVPLALGALSGAISAALLWLGPPGNDTAAHVYQLWLYQHHGLTPWDNYWYSGRWVFVTYSLLYYPLAAVVGIKLLAVISVATAAAAFARLVRWTPAAVTFAVVWGAYTISGAYPFMLGAALALLALLTRRVWLFALLAALTWAVSPLAVLMLAVAVVGMRRRKESLITLGLIALQVVLAHVFHGRGHFPFPWPEILAALVFSVGGAIFARDRALRGIFVAYTALVVLSVAFQSQLGENAARLRFAALPLALLVVRGHRLWIAVPLVALCTAYNITPLAIAYEKGREERAHNHSFWVPAIDFLRAHEDPNFRVNAIDTVGHWEAVHLPEAGFPITRGWYRQDDFPENEILYSDDLNMKTYVRWLHERGVRYVLVPRDRLDYSSKREAVVAAKLHFVTRRGDVSIYEVPRPRSIAPGATILRLTHDQVTLRVPKAGRYTLAIRGHETFVAPRSGTFTLDFS